MPSLPDGTWGEQPLQVADGTVPATWADYHDQPLEPKTYLEIGFDREVLYTAPKGNQILAQVYFGTETTRRSDDMLNANVSRANMASIISGAVGLVSTTAGLCAIGPGDFLLSVGIGFCVLAAAIQWDKRRPTFRELLDRDKRR